MSLQLMMANVAISATHFHKGDETPYKYIYIYINIHRLLLDMQPYAVSCYAQDS